jgi:hypothetical protein
MARAGRPAATRQVDEALELLAVGMTVSDACHAAGIGVATFKRHQGRAAPAPDQGVMLLELLHALRGAVR